MYVTLKRDPSYKKHVSWFVLPTNVPKGKSSIAIAEYVGTFPVHARKRICQISHDLLQFTWHVDQKVKFCQVGVASNIAQNHSSST